MSFIPDWSTILQFAVATFIIAITPGPDMTLFVGRALSEGRKAGFACMAGAMTGIVIHTTLVALGLSALIVASPQAFMALKIVGAGYLVWLAFQAITKGSAFSPDTTKREPRSVFQNWATGLGINLLNPKIILFFMTFLPQFVSAHDTNAPGKLFFIPASAGYGISECFQPGSHCGKIVADSWCQTQGKGPAIAYGKADDITATIPVAEKRGRQIETGSYVVRCSD